MGKKFCVLCVSLIIFKNLKKLLKLKYYKSLDKILINIFCAILLYKKND